MSSTARARAYRPDAEASTHACLEFTASPDAELSAGPSEEEHTKWARSLWRRMDRDNSGQITLQELNCEEFENVLRLVLVPKGGERSVTYGRAELNVSQAIELCLRKADVNNDGVMSFEEFNAFLRILRDQGDAKHTAFWIFALFDLKGTFTIDNQDFKRIYQYYTGHLPTEDELQEEWNNLAGVGSTLATREQYAQWLQTSANPIFRQHAPPVAGEVGEDAMAAANEQLNGKLLKGLVKPNPKILPHLRRHVRPPFKPGWDDSFNARDMVAVTNPSAAKRNKVYFSKTEKLTDSLDALSQYYQRMPHFESCAKRLAEPESAKSLRVLSTDTAMMETTLPGRHKKHSGQMMTNARGQQVKWTDTWQIPGSMKVTNREAGCNMLRCLGEPPEWIKLGKVVSRPHPALQSSGGGAPEQMTRSASAPAMQKR